MTVEQLIKQLELLSEHSKEAKEWPVKIRHEEDESHLQDVYTAIYNNDGFEPYIELLYD